MRIFGIKALPSVGFSLSFTTTSDVGVRTYGVNYDQLFDPVPAIAQGAGIWFEEAVSLAGSGAQYNPAQAGFGGLMIVKNSGTVAVSAAIIASSVIVNPGSTFVAMSPMSNEFGCSVVNNAATPANFVFACAASTAAA
jgi:hypothetical protein